MTIKAYGKSVKTYTAWVAETEYQLGGFRVPTVDNGLCYEVTTAGISSSGETPVEPSWPDLVGLTVKDGTVVWTCREKEAEANPLSVTISVENAGGYSLKDIWVSSDLGENEVSEFIVYGSYEGVNWRQIDEIDLPHGSRNNRHKGFQTAYPFIKVETEAVFNNEIEIVASQS